MKKNTKFLLISVAVVVIIIAIFMIQNNKSVEGFKWTPKRLNDRNLTMRRYHGYHPFGRNENSGHGVDYQGQKKQDKIENESKMNDRRFIEHCMDRCTHSGWGCNAFVLDTAQNSNRPYYDKCWIKRFDSDQNGIKGYKVKSKADYRSTYIKCRYPFCRDHIATTRNGYQYYVKNGIPQDHYSL
jgi:hypothetical protein